MNNELIKIAKKSADEWRGTQGYTQAAEIIDLLVTELSAYHNTGLTLEEISTLKAELMRYQTAEQDGSLLWLPYPMKELSEESLGGEGD